MEIDFEYNKEWLPQNTINVKDIGQFALEASNDEGYFFYLVIFTQLGISTIASAGPVIPDVEELNQGYSCSMYTMEYKEDKLIKTINNWLNDRSKKITQAREVTIDEALDQFRDLGEYLRRFKIEEQK